jgi:Domain of unknown function (DUF4136)
LTSRAGLDISAGWMPRRTALAVCLLAVACGPHVDVHGERSRIATFGRYGTYAWASPATPAGSVAEQDASLLDWRIRNAVDRALAAKGYVRSDGAASLLAEYDVVTRSEDGAAFRDYFAKRRTSGDSRLSAAGYSAGSLVLHLVDARTGEIAYRSSATSVIAADGDRRRLDEAVDRMLADLPRAMDTSRGAR